MRGMTASQPPRKRCFDPVVDQRTRLLLLGSLPGEQSLALQQYYGNGQNKFWELLGAVIDVNLRALSYDERLTTLLARGIGLWDVIAEAERPGSLDASIRNATHNGLADLVATLPHLRAIGFNGGTSARQGRRQLKHLADRLALVDLPSSSPAYTLAFSQKQRAWAQLGTHLDQTLSRPRKPLAA
ncbi:MAG: DNA-deoxyinosine glycosylase [Pseudomonadota bacterium]